MADRRAFLGELIVEAVAIFIVISFGCSVAAMIVLYDPNPYKNAYWGVCITWGIAVAVTLSIYVTGAISGTHANPAVTPFKAFLDQIILTAFLMFGIFAVTDEYNTMAPQANFGAVIIGLLVAVIGASAGNLEAWAINPARPWASHLRLAVRLGRVRVSRPAELLVGPDRGAADRWRDRRRAPASAHPPFPAAQ